MDKIINVFSAIVVVALVSVIATAPNTAAVIKASGEAFANSVKAAKG